MAKKRKNRGRRKGSKGSESMVQCYGCGKMVPILLIVGNLPSPHGEVFQEEAKEKLLILELGKLPL